MIKSMTAYGRAECTHGEMEFIAEIKSLNNRYRDLVLRIPKSLQALEDDMRSQVFSKIRRGRIEISIQMVRNSGEVEYALELNSPLVSSYFRILKELNEKFGLDANVRAEYLCQMKDVILYKPEDVDMDKARPGLKEVLEKALDSLDEMRVQEGSAIEQDFSKRLSLVEDYLDQIEDRAPGVVEEYRKRLKDKIHKIWQEIEIDESRLMQEVAIFSDRCDITEEIVRTRSHLSQFRNYMNMDDSIGRRLDFLIQEINREVNTISAKASDSFISAKVVEVKAELEKLREQAQNVE